MKALSIFQFTFALPFRCSLRIYSVQYLYSTVRVDVVDMSQAHSYFSKGYDIAVTLGPQAFLEASEIVLMAVGILFPSKFLG